LLECAAPGGDEHPVDPVGEAAARRRKPRRRTPAKPKPKRGKAKARRKTAQRCQAPRRGRLRASASLYAVDAKRKRRKAKRRACVKKRKPLKRTPVQPVPPPPAPPPGAPAEFRLSSPVAVYSGAFGARQAERLLWRAGFGTSPGHAEFLAGMGLHSAVASLTRPAGAETFTGAEPTDDDGYPLAPQDAWGHDHLWFLDRMVRTNQPLMQRMTLIWHDWFATSNDAVGQQSLMLAQNNLFRAHALGSFDRLVHDVTVDPAMLIWLNGVENRRNRPNENYARELMELFTLGADRGAYTETDVRELARALTGWRRDWTAELGYHNFRFYGPWFDGTNKTVFGQTGNWNWENAAAMCVRHSLHPSFFVSKLWSYFIPTPIAESDRAALEVLYVQSGYQVRPVVEAILLHPQLHEGPRMVKSPVLLLAGMLRAQRMAVASEGLAWYCENAGQRLFYPPDVSGWDDTRWLDTSTVRGRWDLIARVLSGRQLQGSQLNDYDIAETPEQGVAAARGFWGDPNLTSETVSVLTGFAAAAVAGSLATWQRRQYRGLRQNALRQLIPFSPDYQTS
jgi:uncharacterized protein (DUF1800 family)